MVTLRSLPTLAAIGLCLVAAPLRAQVPPPVPALADAERRTTYNISASTCTCAVNFPIFGDGTDTDAWIEVWVGGVRYVAGDASFGWTLTSATGTLATIPRPITNAVLTFNAPHTGTVQIVGNRRPRRAVQVQENGGVPARAFNQTVTDIIATERETWDRTNDLNGRVLRAPPGDTLSTLPAATTRAGQAICFDPTGLIPLACAPGGGGNVVGPAGATSGHLAIFSGSTGLVIADGGAIAPRTTLASSRTYFVNGSTGNDSNNGLTAGAPFLTPNKAFTTVCNSLDLSGQTVLIDLSDAGAFTGTYSAINNICAYTGYSSANAQATLIVQGAAARSATCVNYPTLSGGITGVSNGFPWTFKNLQINGQTTADAGTFIAFDGDCFGTTTGPHMSAVNAGSKIEFINSPYTINGAATGGHLQASFGGQVLYQTTATPVTITGTPAMGGTFAALQYGGSLLCQDITFTGAVAASTKHYTVDSSSSIKCGTTAVTADPNLVLPGDTTGTGLGTASQLLTSVGPGGTPTYNNITNFVQVTAPLTASGTTTTTIGCAGCVGISGIGHGNSNYVVQPTDRYIYTNVAFTAPRTWTLPAANSVNSGTTIWVQDAQGTVTSTNTLTIARAGADTVNVGSTSIIISGAGGGITFTSDGISNWGTPVQTVSTGGTGQITLTNHGVLVGAGTNPLTQLSAGANGSLLLGVTGADPAFAAMSGDATITNAGAITVTKMNGVDQTTAWTAYTPSPTCGTATFTVNSARAKTLGKTTWVQADIVITAIGTCAVTNLAFTLPNTANSSAALVGREQVNSNKGIDCVLTAASATASCLRTDDTTWLVNDRMIVSGVYENQ